MGADGGVYAELVKNRSFEFDTPMMGWKDLRDEEADGSIVVHNIGDENPANRRYVRARGKNVKLLLASHPIPIVKIKAS